MAKKRTSQAKKQRDRRFMIVFWLIVIIALILIFNRPMAGWLANRYQPAVNREQIVAAQKRAANYDWDQVERISLDKVALAQLQKDRIQVIGLLTIPDINMYLPIAAGVDNVALALAAGTMRANQVMGQGNYPLASHHMASKTALFGPLYYQAEAGQMIYVTDLDKVYAYEAQQPEFIPATDVQVVDDVPGKALITLITCDATGNERLMVQGELTATYDYHQAPKEALAGFTQANGA
jgi:sortase A